MNRYLLALSLAFSMAAAAGAQACPHRQAQVETPPSRTNRLATIPDAHRLNQSDRSPQRPVAGLGVSPSNLASNGTHHRLELSSLSAGNRLKNPMPSQASAFAVTSNPHRVEGQTGLDRFSTEAKLSR